MKTITKLEIGTKLDVESVIPNSCFDGKTCTVAGFHTRLDDEYMFVVLADDGSKKCNDYLLHDIVETINSKPNSII
jgi:hypothetical protein